MRKQLTQSPSDKHGIEKEAKQGAAKQNALERQSAFKPSPEGQSLLGNLEHRTLRELENIPEYLGGPEREHTGQILRSKKDKVTVIVQAKIITTA